MGWLGEERSTGATSSKEGRGQYKGSGNKQANKQAHGGHRRALERGGPVGSGCPVCQGCAAPLALPRPTNSHSLLACAAAPRLCGARYRGGTALNEERKKPNTCRRRRRRPYRAAAAAAPRPYCCRQPGRGSASVRQAAGDPWGLLAATAG